MTAKQIVPVPSPLLQDAIRLCRERKEIRATMRQSTFIPIDDRCRDFKRHQSVRSKQIFDLTQQIDQLMPHLSVEDVEELKVKYG